MQNKETVNGCMRCSELGSEYNLSLRDLTKKDSNIYEYLYSYENVVFFDSGRSAIKHFASKISEDEEVLLPEFICESVTRCFNNVDFYRINEDFTIDIDDLKEHITNKTKCIFLMHYFGSVQPKEVLEQIVEIAKNNNFIILEDTTHSIFSIPSTIGDYQICSIRKWMPISGGGILYSQTDKMNLMNSISYPISSNNNRVYGMILKDIFLSEKYDCNKQYRKIFVESEDELDNQKDIFLMSDLSKFIIECIDVEELKEIRIRNYRYLMKELLPAVSLGESECPLVMPIIVEERDEFRNYLMKNRIYCAVHWPFDGIQHYKRRFASNCAEHLISLPLDQRYSIEDMCHMMEIIKQYKGAVLCCK